MRKLHLLLVVLMVAFAVSMLALNLHLSVRNSQLRAQLNAEFQRHALENTPVPGWVMPPLKGHDPKGNPLEINLQSPGGRKLLLVFSPACEVCNENWPKWDSLLMNSEISSYLLPISFEKSVSGDYLKQHKIADRPVLVALAPNTAASMRLVMTPQTILVNDGRVVQSWTGRLSAAHLRDILEAMK